MPDILSTIPLSALRTFDAAARLKSFTAAASELGVTQAAVSWQVKALEQRLGQPLFRRLPREVALTLAGERLARATDEAMRLLRGALADLSEGADGVLSITTSESLASQWLAPRLGAFQLANPKLAVRLDTGPRLADLDREGFDLAIRSGSGDWPGLESLYLFPSSVTPLCTNEVREQLGGLARPEELANAPLIGLDAAWSDWFAAAGVSERPASAIGRLIADLQVLEVASALAGRGVALGSPVLFAAEIAQGRLVRPFDLAVDQAAGVWLAYPAERRRVRKIAAFRDWVMAAAG
jgi:LysR family glycine cleavage system transcriptional activator